MSETPETPDTVTLSRATAVALEDVLYTLDRYLMAPWDDAERKRCRAAVLKAHPLLAQDAGVVLGEIRSATGFGAGGYLRRDG